MRILRVANIPNNRHGGMSRTMHGTGEEFAKAGHVVEYLFAEEFDSRMPQKLRRFSDPWTTMRLVVSRINQAAFDVIEIHEPIAGAYAWRRRYHPDWPPLVAFSYGLEERGRQAMLRYRQAKAIPVRTISRITSWLTARQAAFAVRRADHVVCSNETDATHLIARGIPSSRITRHFSGVDAAFLEAPPTEAAANRKRLLFVGTWIERKGILDLIEAFAVASRNHPDITLTVAGCLVDARSVLESFPPHLRSRVRVIPRIASDDELIALYQEHGVFVLPSYFEGQPLSLIEAAAMGLAPIVTDIGGCRDFVTHEENGFLVKTGDPLALANYICIMANTEAVAGRYGQECRLRASRHTWRMSAQQLLAAYAKLVENNRQQRDTTSASAH